MDENTVLLVQAIVCIIIALFYPDIVAKILAIVLLVWTVWWTVTG
jgi:predicted RND superfamily exporter protein